MSRPPLVPVSSSGYNARTSLGPTLGGPRKSILTASSSSSSTVSANSSAQTGRKSLGGKKEDPKQTATAGTAPRRSMLPPSQPRPSLSTNSRPGVNRQSLSSRPSISTNRRNSRGSISQSNSRESLSRRTSVYGQGEGQLKDPRPVKEKPFINGCIHRLVQFLTDNYYDKPINPQTLVCPSSRDFFSILEFLLRRVDPAFGFKDAKKPEEETPALFKHLRYPFGMSSRSLHSVGTPHAWPTFLAALHWLIELLTYDESAQMQRDEMMAEDRISQEALRYSFFNFISQAYHAFMSTNDSLEQELEANFVRALLDRNDERRESISSKQEHTKQLLQECSRLKNHETRVHMLTEDIETCEKDLEKFKAYVHDLNESNKVTNEKLVEMKSIAAAEKEAVERLQEEIMLLEKRLTEQLDRNLDVDKLSKERKELDMSISMAVAHRDEIEKSTWSIEMEVSQKFAEVDRSVSTFNQHVRATGLLSSLRTELRVNPQAFPILSMDLKSIVKPVLISYLAEQRKSHQENQQVMVEMYTKADQIQDELAAKRAEVSDLNSRLEFETLSLQKSKESFEESKRSLDAQILSLEKEAEALMTANRDLLLSREKDRTDAIRRTKEKTVHFKVERHELCETTLKYTEWIAEHKEYIDGKLAQLANDLSKQIDSTAY